MDRREQHPEFDLVKANMETALGGFFTALYRTGGWLGGYSADIDDQFWNLLIPSVQQPATPLSDACSFFDRLDREPTLYGEKEWLQQFTASHGLDDLEQGFTDSWMEFQGDPAPPTETFDYTEVSSPAERDRFTEIFGRAFGDDGDDDPYGGLGEGYISGIERTLAGIIGAGTCRSILVTDGGDHVGIGTLAVTGDIGFVYNIATVPEHQQNGIGTAATRKIVAMAREEGVDRIILQTEAESYVEDFYSDLGFETVMRADGLTGLSTL